MKKFIIPVARIGYGFANIEVDANSQKEAEEQALDVAGDHEFAEKSSDYEIEGGSPKFTLEDLEKAFKDGRKYEADELELDTKGRNNVFEVWKEEIFDKKIKINY